MDFDLNLFTNTYIRTSFEIVGLDTCIELGEYYQQVFQRVSERMEISPEDVKYLHNAFHWGLFLKEHSPLQMVSSGTAFSPRTDVRRGSAPWWQYSGYTGGLAEKIIKENKGWLEERAKRIPLPEDFFNNFGP